LFLRYEEERCCDEDRSIPRYFFEAYDGERFVSGSNGLELPGTGRDALPSGDQQTYVICVKDETGQVLLRAGLKGPHSIEMHAPSLTSMASVIRPRPYTS